jgi:uroporphyrinogen III methyltransferase/synthase
VIKAATEKIRPPSIIVIGDVVSLREQLSWYETRPLFGKTIVVTRSREQSSELTARLEELGARVIEAPAIRILPPEDPAPLSEAAGNAGDYDWIIFTSVNGVRFFFENLYARGLDARSLARCRVCAIGSATENLLRGHGVIADLVPERFISSDLIRALDERGEIRNNKFLLPRADIAPREMSEALKDGGAGRVDDIVAYRTVMDESMLPDGSAFDLVTFTSSSTVKNFDALYRRGTNAPGEPPRCVAIGPVTARTARELGYTVERVAEEHTIDGLVKAVLDLYR